MYCQRTLQHVEGRSWDSNPPPTLSIDPLSRLSHSSAPINEQHSRSRRLLQCARWRSACVSLHCHFAQVERVNLLEPHRGKSPSPQSAHTSPVNATLSVKRAWARHSLPRVRVRPKTEKLGSKPHMFPQHRLGEKKKKKKRQTVENRKKKKNPPHFCSSD